MVPDTDDGAAADVTGLSQAAKEAARAGGWDFAGLCAGRGYDLPGCRGRAGSVRKAKIIAKFQVIMMPRSVRPH
jgi:hypothetical protein